MTVKIGIIGASGYWGRKVLSALLALPNVEVLACAGHSDRRKLADVVKSHYPQPPCPLETLDYQRVIHLPSLDAVIISTPAETHFSIARDALWAGKHVFLEKPMCLHLDEAQGLQHLAETEGKILFIDHTYLHSECLHFIKDKLDSGELGSGILLYFHSHRTQLGIYRSHSVLWDLGPHDLSIVKYLFPDEVIENAHAVGWSSFGSHTNKPNEAIKDTVFFKLSYRSGFSASAFLSWCYPKRARDIIIAGENRMTVFENNSKVSIFEHNLSLRVSQESIQWHLVEQYSSNGDPLRNSLQCFVECLEREIAIPPRCASPGFACEIIAVLERIEESMKRFIAPGPV